MRQLHTATEQIDLCAVLPVCNEAESIVPVVAELCAVLAAVPTLMRVALLIVDDCSQDDGSTRLKEWFSTQRPRGFSLTVMRLQQRQGMSIAILKGCKLAVNWSPRLTLVMDADGQDDPAFIADMVARAATADIVFALRGKRSEALPFRICYAAFQFLLWLGSGQSARHNQFCVLRPPVLAHVAALHYIDYLGALLNASPFSRATLVAARRARLAGQSKFSIRGHVHTAFTIMSWQPRLLKRMHRFTLLSLIVLGGAALSLANTFATLLLLLFAVCTQLWWAKLVSILSLRANSRPFTLDERIEEIAASDEPPAQRAAG